MIRLYVYARDEPSTLCQKKVPPQERLITENWKHLPTENLNSPKEPNPREPELFFYKIISRTLEEAVAPNSISDMRVENFKDYDVEYSIWILEYILK